MHFERGRDTPRAVQYLRQAEQHSLERSAYVEAVAHLTRGLEVLKTLPATPERTQQELTLHITLGTALLVYGRHARVELRRFQDRSGYGASGGDELQRRVHSRPASQDGRPFSALALGGKIKAFVRLARCQLSKRDPMCRTFLV
jgi:hypothetical protein